MLDISVQATARGQPRALLRREDLDRFGRERHTLIDRLPAEFSGLGAELLHISRVHAIGPEHRCEFLNQTAPLRLKLSKPRLVTIDDSQKLRPLLGAHLHQVEPRRTTFQPPPNSLNGVRACSASVPVDSPRTVAESLTHRDGTNRRSDDDRSEEQPPSSYC